MNGYYGYYGYPPPPSEGREKRMRTAALVYVGLVGLVVVGVGSYVLLQRLDTAVLTVIATVGCAAGVALPGLILALAVLLRQRERQANGQAGAIPMTPPQVVVIPPMQFQPPSLLPGGPPTQVETVQVQPRRFTVVGEE